MNPLLQIKALGQSPWLDYIQRGILENGEFQRLIREDGICGVTSNPTIFAKAVTEHDDYRQAIARLRPQCSNVIELYEALALEDIRLAADLLAPIYAGTHKLDGYVSLEVTPDLAYDANTSVREARRLWAAIDRPNAMIKIPATRPGLDAIRELTAEGLNINATLIFSPQRYSEVARAWAEGLQQRLQQGLPVDHISSVASFFLSRIDTLADRWLEEKAATQPAARELLGKMAVAAARSAYDEFKQLQLQPDWQEFATQNVHLQRPLWASTSTKNPAYSDVKYLDELIGPQTVNTLPLETLAAYRDHGQPAPRLEEDPAGARGVLEDFATLGLDFARLAEQLEREGVEKFQASYQQLLTALEQAP